MGWILEDVDIGLLGRLWVGFELGSIVMSLGLAENMCEVAGDAYGSVEQ